jgi:hypothetical protein
VELDFGLIVATEIDDSGWIGLQIDAYGEKKASVSPGEPCFPCGLIAAPHDPDLDVEGVPIPSAACGAMYGYDGSDLQVWPLVDPRDVAALPHLEKGGRLFYGGRKGAPSYVRINGDTGAMSIVVPSSAASVVVDDEAVKLGNPASAVPVALATQLLAYLDVLEQAVKTAVGAAGSPAAATAAGAVFAATMQAAGTLRSQIAATLVKGF